MSVLSDAIARFLANEIRFNSFFTSLITTVAGTSYILLSTDNLKTIVTTNGSAVALTIPPGLPAAFKCTVIQKGAGVVTVGGGSITLLARGSKIKTAGQYAVIYINNDGVTDEYVVSGDAST